MALDPQKSLVLFVPGIMGSVLRYRGPDRYGNATEEILWGTDGLQNLRTLSMTPEKMRAPGYAFSVIRSMLTVNAAEEDVYGSLLRFCASDAGLGLQEGINFHPFPYDWRQDNAISANQLADRIAELDPGGEKDLYLIAHSMGGLVCRLAITTRPEIQSRIRLFFQIASPVEGSPKAYWTLNKYPQFSKFIDMFYLRKHFVDPNRRAQLLLAVQGFTSVFQLLPPRHVMTLLGVGRKEYPALHPDAWPMQLQSQLVKAEAIHPALEIPKNIPMHCVYSSNGETPWRFAVDRFWSITARYNKVDGDETVPASSAMAHSNGSRLFEALGDLTEHMALCRHPGVRDELKRAFQ